MATIKFLEGERKVGSVIVYLTKETHPHGRFVVGRVTETDDGKLVGVRPLARYRSKHAAQRGAEMMRDRDAGMLFMDTSAGFVLSVATMTRVRDHEIRRLLSNDQQGLCAICRHSETWRPRGKWTEEITDDCGKVSRRWRHVQGETSQLSLDHDHKTDRIRSLLCRRCNLIIGFVKDNPAILRAAIEYLARHGKET